MKKDDLDELIEKYVTGKASAKDIQALNEWYLNAEPDMQENVLPNDEKLQLSNHLLQNLMKEIQHKGKKSDQKVQRRLLDNIWFRAAAVIILFLSAGTYYFFSTKNESVQTANQQLAKLTPGHNKATLQLADGRSIILENQPDGVLADQNGVKIVQLDSGLLAYQGGSPGKIEYNTLITPRGGQYQIVLPDGSKAWLNSASSLYYPTVFSTKSREVTLTGEGYFEIKKGKVPFIVKTPNQVINVLGTSFNVMAYQDENTIKTTLVEGAIKVGTGNKSIILKPGQQSMVNKNNALEIAEADFEEVLAWKQGKFRFDNAHITTIMKQLSRWYDVEVIYDGQITEKGISGFMSRTENAEELLEVFEETGLVHFDINGKKITVRNGARKK
jgi:transmembrane sensor